MNLYEMCNLSFPFYDLMRYRNNVLLLLHKWKMLIHFYGFAGFFKWERVPINTIFNLRFLFLLKKFTSYYESLSRLGCWLTGRSLLRHSSWLRIDLRSIPFSALLESFKVTTTCKSAVSRPEVLALDYDWYIGHLDQFNSEMTSCKIIIRSLIGTWSDE